MCMCFILYGFAREEKAKVVAAVWGNKMYSIPCRASCLAPGLYEEKD